MNKTGRTVEGGTRPGGRWREEQDREDGGERNKTGRTVEGGGRGGVGVGSGRTVDSADVSVTYRCSRHPKQAQLGPQAGSRGGRLVGWQAGGLAGWRAGRLRKRDAEWINSKCCTLNRLVPVCAFSSVTSLPDSPTPFIPNIRNIATTQKDLSSDQS